MRINAALLGMAIVATPILIARPATASTLIHINENAPAMAGHNSQGYLGVGLREVAEDQMNSFHVPAARGLEIIMLDHDAPAAKAGLKEHDVILRSNGEAVESVEKFRRMVRETPPGHLLALIISRGGSELTIPVKVADRAQLEKQAWAQHMTVIPEDEMDMSMVAPQNFGRTVPGSGFFATTTMPSYYTGVIVDALGPQLASFFGAQTGYGLLVKSVDVNSPAANAGVKAGDVIIKVGQTQMATRNDFFHAVREHKGKQVTITLLRDKKEQTVTLNVGKNTKSSVDRPNLPDMVEVQRMIDEASRIQVAELQPEIAAALANAQAATGPEMEKLREQMRNFEATQPQIAEQMKQLQNMEPRIRQQMKTLEPQLRELMKHNDLTQPQVQEAMKHLQDIQPQLQEQMKQLQDIEPQIREQMKNLEPQLQEQMNLLKDLEPQLREQMKTLQEQQTPII